MKSTTKALLALLVLALAIGVAAAQKEKPWIEWTKKDAQKVLNESGWGQTQIYTDTSEMTWSTATRPIDGKGAVNQATSVSYFIRFLSAKPIRQAFARLAELDPQSNTPQQLKAARDFVEDRKFEQIVSVAVDCQTKDGRYYGPAFQAFGSAITSTLKNNTFLELKGGKRIFLQEYQPPAVGGVGAIFNFPKLVDGKPLIEAKTGDIRFYALFPGKMSDGTILELNMRFKIDKMVYEGVIEY
jgi:hypothetical protein